MVNALYRFAPMGPNAAWRPYLGGGVGWANLEVSSEWMGSFERDDALAYQVIGGAAYALTPEWSLTGEVRWFATDGGTLDGGRWLSLDTRFQTVDVLLGRGLTASDRRDAGCGTARDLARQQTTEDPGSAAMSILEELEIPPRRGPARRRRAGGSRRSTPRAS